MAAAVRGVLSAAGFAGAFPEFSKMVREEKRNQASAAAVVGWAEAERLCEVPQEKELFPEERGASPLPTAGFAVEVREEMEVAFRE